MSNIPPVPFNDLGRNTVALRSELDEAIARVVSSGWYVLGPEHDAFEAELAEYLGVTQVIGVGNGTDALQLALSALNVTAGSTVLTAANAGGYTSTAVRSLGAVPVYSDVDADSLLVTVDSLTTALAGLSVKPDAIVVTHLFGSAADISSIVSWAHGQGIPVVEDCAQALGAVVGGVKAGSVADIATTSFYPTKNLGALGDGGAVMTSSADLAARVRQLRQYGWESKYRTTIAGGRNSRLDELQAAILRVKLPYLDGWNARRREIHAQYAAALGSGARLVNGNTDSFVGHLAVVEVEDRAAARAVLEARGVRTDVHYPIPDHLQPLLDGSQHISLPVTETAADRIFSLPLFPELTSDEISVVSSAIAGL